MHILREQINFFIEPPAFNKFIQVAFLILLYLVDAIYTHC